jgi:N-hydroxyarylamine O-acetyltransferase
LFPKTIAVLCIGLTVSDHVIDLDAYFARIGYTGRREAALATLRAIHVHHVRAIPFENLDVLLGRGIRIDVPSIEQKLVHDRRGGYCFEQNGLLAAVLRTLGFRVTPLIARVRWQLPADQPTALTHMLLRVDTDEGPYLADVGFGSMSLFQPIRFEFDLEQSGSLELRRLIRRGLIVAQQARLGDEWSDVYHFAPDPAPTVDFELGNWFTSTHPQSRFVQNLVVARAGEDCRYTLLNRELTIRHGNGQVDKQSIDSSDQLLAVLVETFALRFPAGTRFGRTGAPWRAD